MLLFTIPVMVGREGPGFGKTIRSNLLYRLLAEASGLPFILMDNKLIARYKLNNIDCLDHQECDQAILILRYLLDRCDNPEEINLIRSYIQKVKEKQEAFKP